MTAAQPARDNILSVTMELAHGREWTWFRDVRIVALSPHLDQAGRERALCELAQQLERKAADRRTRLRRGAAAAQRGF